MKIITDEKVIKRNTRFGFWASMASPVIMVFSAMMILNQPDLMVPALIVFLIGAAAFAIGMAFRKYSRGTELELNQVLKKLNNKYSIYHFHTPVSHLLVGPAGIWMLHPKHVQGRVTYNERRKRWRLKQIDPLSRILFFLVEGLGNPQREIMDEARALDRYLKKKWSLEEKPQVQAVMVMMNEKAEVQADNAHIPTVHISQLREFLRKQEQQNKMPASVIKEFKRTLEQ